jgi:signal transduction histidine kinase
MSETPSTMEAKVRTGDDRLELFLPVARGNATVAFGSDLDFATTFPFAAVAAVCAIAAAFFGSLLARLISRDLSNATTRLRALGTEEVLRGVHDEPFPARFQVVGKLAEAALALADRFRVFAGAQERALEARENARRMRGLLFASVSHDLKSPLNAILGFADTIDRATLGEAQRESLDLISTRGRELVALIETILDAARVEAGQLALSRDLEKVATVLAVSAKRARELAIEAGELRVEMVGDIPKVDVDLTHLTRALAVVVAHALRAASAETTGGKGEVTVRATLDPKGDRVRIDIDHGPSTISAEELQALLSRQSSSRGKGLTLGLSLARSIFELHGGSIEVAGTPGGGPVVTTYIPTKPRARATRPSVI